jgi:hypothetical protein
MNLNKDRVHRKRKLFSSFFKNMLFKKEEKSAFIGGELSFDFIDFYFIVFSNTQDDVS